MLVSQLVLGADLFRRNTVFVVGAGASKELGLPTGAELSGLIAGLCDAKLDDWGRLRDRDVIQMLNAFEAGAGTTPEKASKWLNLMREIEQALPFKDSIDAVIDQYHDRPEIAKVGKYMIAKLIIQAEAKSALRPTREGIDVPDLSRCKDTWLQTFSRMLFEGLRKDRLEDIGSNVAIICFNYDRCIERYLSHAIAHAYGLETREAIDFAAEVRIIHAYGLLGALPGWPMGTSGKPTVAFGGDSNPAQMAYNLRTFSESVDDDTDEAIKRLVSEAEQYVYLGFSFGRQNMELLGANSRTGRGKERPAYASGLGQYEQGRDAICQLIQKTYSADRPLVAPGAGPHPKTRLELNTTAKALLDLHWHNILG